MATDRNRIWDDCGCSSFSSSSYRRPRVESGAPGAPPASRSCWRAPQKSNALPPPPPPLASSFPRTRQHLPFSFSSSLSDQVALPSTLPQGQDDERHLSSYSCSSFSAPLAPARAVWARCLAAVIMTQYIRASPIRCRQRRTNAADDASHGRPAGLGAPHWESRASDSAMGSAPALP